MPPKAKLHKCVGKPKLPARLQTEVSTPSETNQTELEKQFEVELCWCIQQLQTALKSGKLNQRQTQDHIKACNVLMSNKAPMIKKRQVMSNSFGDYRAKMKTESQRLSKNSTQMKVAPGKPSTKSFFVKKSVFNAKPSGDYKFNFDVPKTAVESDIATCEKRVNVNLDNDKFHFSVSDNSFRFNFSEDENVTNVNVNVVDA